VARPNSFCFRKDQRTSGRIGSLRLAQDRGSSFPGLFLSFGNRCGMTSIAPAVRKLFPESSRKILRVPMSQILFTDGHFFLRRRSVRTVFFPPGFALSLLRTTMGWPSRSKGRRAVAVAVTSAELRAEGIAKRRDDRSAVGSTSSLCTPLAYVAFPCQSKSRIAGAGTAQNSVEPFFSCAPAFSKRRQVRTFRMPQRVKADAGVPYFHYVINPPTS